ncbi:MAG TPA: group I intron-associated PD-(D/E)XK endonuclease [Terriglobales bacterium]|nr:group I intron-associated PD-(D/E)XK endonuclease [Terriglobales bacterium]
MSTTPNRKPHKRQKPQPPKPTPPAPRKNTKVTGERSEAAFLDRAIQRNFGVAKPWGDSRRYDFILDNGQCLHRIQVKCTESIRARAYETRATYTVGKKRAVYTKKDIDFIAAHVVPLDLWYIIPVEVCTPAPMLRFYPHRKARKMRLEPYREAWHWILPKEGVDENGRIEIQASADETIYPEHVDLEHADLEHVDPKPVDPEYDRTTNAAPGKDHVGTAALGCPAGQSPAALSPATSRATPKTPIATLQSYRNLCAKTPATRLNPTLAPWPIPPVKILAARKGKKILPNPPD